MINANELRIGNYISSGYYVTKDQLIIISDGEDIDFYCEKFTIMPIELTEEWLAKFGFEKDGFNAFNKDISPFGENGISFRILCFSHDYLYIRDGMLNEPRHKDSLNVLWNKDIMKQFYVHQLQNLYFALTGKELEYDKKVRNDR